MSTAIGVSVLVLTRNEQQDLPRCLKSVAWSDDVHVYDSMSDDGTVAIALAHGAQVTQRPGQNTGLLFGGGEADHRNRGLRNIRFKYRWVFQIDADERVTPELADQPNVLTTRYTRALSLSSGPTSMRARALLRKLRYTRASPPVCKRWRLAPRWCWILGGH